MEYAKIMSVIIIQEKNMAPRKKGKPKKKKTVGETSDRKSVDPVATANDKECDTSAQVSNVGQSANEDDSNHVIVDNHNKQKRKDHGSESIMGSQRTSILLGAASEVSPSTISKQSSCNFTTLSFQSSLSNPSSLSKTTSNLNGPTPTRYDSKLIFRDNKSIFIASIKKELLTHVFMNEVFMDIDGRKNNARMYIREAVDTKRIITLNIIKDVFVTMAAVELVKMAKDKRHQIRTKMKEQYFRK